MATPTTQDRLVEQKIRSARMNLTAAKDSLMEIYSGSNKKVLESSTYGNLHNKKNINECMNLIVDALMKINHLQGV